MTARSRSLQGHGRCVAGSSRTRRVVASGIDPEPVIIVSPDNKEIISNSLGAYKAKYIIQDKQLGTGHAVACAREAISSDTKNIIVLYCDHPFVTAASLKSFSMIKTEALTIMPTILPDYEGWHHNFLHWGRIIRNATGAVDITRAPRALEVRRARARAHT